MADTPNDKPKPSVFVQAALLKMLLDELPALEKDFTDSHADDHTSYGTAYSLGYLHAWRRVIHYVTRGEPT